MPSAAPTAPTAQARPATQALAPAPAPGSAA